MGGIPLRVEFSTSTFFFSRCLLPAPPPGASCLSYRRCSLGPRPRAGSGTAASQRRQRPLGARAAPPSLRRLLGLPKRAPIATIQAGAGQQPLHITWLVRAASFWNSLLDAPAGSVTHTAVEAGLQVAAESAGLTACQLPWSAQLTQAMAALAAGVDLDLKQQEGISAATVRSTALRRYQQQVDTAAQQDGAQPAVPLFGSDLSA